MGNKVFLFLIALFFLSGCLKNTPPNSQKILPSPTVKPIEETFSTWNDEAGFVFQYLEGVDVKQDTADDTSYTNLSLTKVGEDGQILILAKDTKLKDISLWNKNADDIIIGGKNALSSVLEDKKTIGVIDEGILFTIEITGNSPALNTTFAKIKNTFEFVYPTSSAKSTDSSQFDNAIEEESVVEE